MNETTPKGFRPRNGRYLLNTDGGVKNDGRRSTGDPPGEAAIGVVLSDPDDRLVLEFKEAIGPETIPGSEYRALMKGLQIARKYGITKIRAFVDNQLVVDQLNGVARVKNAALRIHYDHVLGILEGFSDWRVYWVPRERNKGADDLVRQVLYPDKVRNRKT